MSKLKIAVQKSGRLHDESMEILKDIGISIDNGKDQLKASARNFPLEVFYLRNGDIPQYLKDGVVDVAIIGENILIEKGNGITIAEKLGFSTIYISKYNKIAIKFPNIKVILVSKIEEIGEKFDDVGNKYYLYKITSI